MTFDARVFETQREQDYTLRILDLEERLEALQARLAAAERVIRVARNIIDAELSAAVAAYDTAARK